MSFNSLLTDRTVVNKTFFDQFKHWPNEVLPYVVSNYSTLPESEITKISRMHHVFCGLHVIHNLGVYADKALLEWESVVEV